MIKMQKVIKVGNSLAITLDKDFVTKVGIKAGDQLAASYKPEKEVLSVSKTQDMVKDKPTSEKEAYVSSRITPEFQKWVEQSLEEDKEAMEALKDL